MHEKANHTPATDDANNESLIENIQQVPEDDVALLPDAMDSLYIKLYLIRHATERIDMVYYMFDNSDSATLMLNEIISAADRGVKIRLLLNDLNHTFTFQQRWRRELLTGHPNISFYLYHNPKLNFYKFNDNIHDKALIVDHDYLITGGRNIQDRFYFKDSPSTVHDLDFCIRRLADSASSAIDDYEHYYEALVHAKPVRQVTTKPVMNNHALRQLLSEAVHDVYRARVSFVHNQLNHVSKRQIFYA